MIGTLAGGLDLFTTLATLVHVAVNVQAVVLVEVGAADEPAAADLALERFVPSVGAMMDGQQVGAHERPSAEVARERSGDRVGGVESGEVSSHAALQRERLGAGRAWDPGRLR